MPTVPQIEGAIARLAAAHTAYSMAFAVANEEYNRRKLPHYPLLPIPVIGGVVSIGTVLDTALVRELAPPVNVAATEYRNAYFALRNMWTAAVDMANNPVRYGIPSDVSETFRERMRLADDLARQANWQLDAYYRSRWYTGDPQRISAWLAYTIRPPAGGSGFKPGTNTLSQVWQEIQQAYGTPTLEPRPTPRPDQGFQLSPVIAVVLGVGGGVAMIALLKKMGKI